MEQYEDPAETTYHTDADTDVDSVGFYPLRERLRDLALQDRVVLQFNNQVWVAEDSKTGEQAIGKSMKGAWAALRETDIRTIEKRIIELKHQ